jgi:hypothetical protein
MVVIEWQRATPRPPTIRTIAVFGGEIRKVADFSLESSVGLGSGQMPHGAISLSRNSLPVDYSAKLVVKAARGESEGVPMFTGFVKSAGMADGQVTLEVATGLTLAESQLPYLKVDGVNPLEVVIAIVEEEAEVIRIEGEPPPSPVEVFSVECPVGGIASGAPMFVGRVRFSSGPENRALVELSKVTGMEAAALATCYVVASTLADAQARGLAHIDLALDRLLLTNLYAFGADPAGRPLDYSRDRWRSRPGRLDGVIVRSLIGTRSWVRGTKSAALEIRHGHDDFVNRWGFLSDHVPENIARAMAALRNASEEEEDTVQRNQALWNALEFYAANVEVAEILAPSDKKAANKAIRGLGLDKQKTDRLLGIIGSANSPPLLTRVFAQAEADGCVLNDDERSLILKLRQGRNDSSHGRLNMGPAKADLRRGVTSVARLLLQHWFRST